MDPDWSFELATHLATFRFSGIIIQWFLSTLKILDYEQTFLVLDLENWNRKEYKKIILNYI